MREQTPREGPFVGLLVDNWRLLTLLGVGGVLTTVLGFTLPGDDQRIATGLTVAALWVSIWSLWVALRQIGRSASAAAAAASAADRATDSMNRHAAATDLARVSERIAHVRKMHGAGQWDRAHERYQEIRLLLSDILHRHEGLASADAKTIQMAIQRFAVIEDKVGKALGDNVLPSLSRAEEQTLRGTEMLLHDLESALKARQGVGQNE